MPAPLSACLPFLRHCRAPDKREGGLTAFLYPGGPQPRSVFISSSINNRLAQHGEINPLYLPSRPGHSSSGWESPQELPY